MTGIKGMVKPGYYVLEFSSQRVVLGPFKKAANAYLACRDGNHYARYCGPDSEGNEGQGLVAESRQRLMDTRYDQMFPPFGEAALARLRRFGEIQTYGSGDRVMTAGQRCPGMFMILSGEVLVTYHHGPGEDRPIVTLGPGTFMAEFAQLSARPALVDAHAKLRVEALVIFERKLRGLLIEEAELGEQIMRALIHRRVALVRPIIFGGTNRSEVLRLHSFLTRNGDAHVVLDPEADAEAKTLVGRFNIDATRLPVVLCPDGQLLHNPSEAQLARVLGLKKAPRPSVGGRQGALRVDALTGDRP